MKTTTAFLIPFLLGAAACDSEEGTTVDAVERTEDRQLADDRGSAAPEPRKLEEMIGHLCAQIDCTQGQASELVAIAAATASQDKFSQQATEWSRRFASMFRAESLDTNALSALRAEMDGRRAEHKATRAAAAAAAHAVLTPQQREQLAKMVETTGFVPRPMGGGFEGAPSVPQGAHAMMAKFAASKMAGQLCGLIECEERQREQLVAAFADSIPAPPSFDGIENPRAEIAASLRAPKLDVSRLEALGDRFESMHEQHEERMRLVLSEVHTILSAKQREAVADTIEDQGMPGLVGGMPPMPPRPMGG